MRAAYQAQVLAADKTANEIHAFSFVVGSDFTALLSCDALHEWRSYIRSERLRLKEVTMGCSQSAASPTDSWRSSFIDQDLAIDQPRFDYHTLYAEGYSVCYSFLS
jgi:hypothetical protein